MNGERYENWYYCWFVSSPYTRALQTAAIISQKTNIDITVEMDLHEWMPDLTFQYHVFEECLELTYNIC